MVLKKLSIDFFMRIDRFFHADGPQITVGHPQITVGHPHEKIKALFFYKAAAHGGHRQVSWQRDNGRRPR